MPDKMNILLIDDKEENLIALEALIERNDIHLFKTTSPNEALKLAWENDIAIALVDVQMPEMDGFELVELLKSNPKTRNIFIIFVTAISKESKYAVKGLNAGAVDYLYKPLDPYITAAKVDSFIQLARTQRELVKKNKELENFAVQIENSADIICVIDPLTYRINSVNSAIERVLGYNPKEVTGHSIIDFSVDKQQSVTRNMLASVAADDKVVISFEDRFRNFNQEVQWLECRMSKKNNLLMLNMSDITVQKNYTNELIRSRDVAEHTRRIKENFLANMSHEIRTPINGIIGLVNILKDTDVNPNQEKMIDLIDISSQSLLGVINDILDLSKIEAGKFSIVRDKTEIRPLVKSICDILKFKADEKGISLITTISENIPQYIIADSLRLNQILMNLMSNAIKFTQKGYVKLSVTMFDKRGNEARIAFDVEDSGVGIPHDKLEHIFDSFSQADNDTANKFGGTGLGLTITKRLAQLKGGELRVKSTAGKGSIFTFENTFVLVEDHLTKQAGAEVEIVPFERNLRVLLAEDNFVNQFAATNLLKKWNVIVDVAENGEVALEKLAANDYDLILMDTYMPVMNGYETTRKIRTEFKGGKQSIPIVSLSAAVLEEEVRQAKEAGMDAQINKPFNPKILYKTIHNLVVQGRNEGQGE
jgi:PAS domain S-box-containing protein